MKIDGFRIRVCQPKNWQLQWRDDIPPVNMTMSLIELGTAAGHTGVATSRLPASPLEIAEQGHHFFRNLILGADSSERERLWHEMMAHARYLIMPKAASLIDIAHTTRRCASAVPSRSSTFIGSRTRFATTTSPACARCAMRWTSWC